MKFEIIKHNALPSLLLDVADIVTPRLLGELADRQRPPRHPRSIKMVTGPNEHGQRPCHLLQQERVRSLAYG